MKNSKSLTEEKSDKLSSTLKQRTNDFFPIENSSKVAAPYDSHGGLHALRYNQGPRAVRTDCVPQKAVEESLRKFGGC